MYTEKDGNLLWWGESAVGRMGAVAFGPRKMDSSHHLNQDQYHQEHVNLLLDSVVYMHGDIIVTLRNTCRDNTWLPRCFPRCPLGPDGEVSSTAHPITLPREPIFSQPLSDY